MTDRKLYKTTIVIWSDCDPCECELSDLARDAEAGESYCSKMDRHLIDDPKSDPDWDGTEFFDGSVDDDGHSLDEDGDQIHQFGPFLNGWITGEPARHCEVLGCKAISLDGDDEDE